MLPVGSGRKAELDETSVVAVAAVLPCGALSQVDDLGLPMIVQPGIGAHDDGV